MVGVYAYPPLVVSTGTGRAEGIFPEVLAEVARREGWSISYVSGSWQENLEWLASGHIDLVLGISRSPDRDATFALSQEPVVSTWAQVYTKADRQIATVLDLDGKRIVGLRGGLYYESFKEFVNGFGVRPSYEYRDTMDDVFAAVNKGDADATVCERFAGGVYERKYGLVRSPVLYNPWALVFGAAKGRNQEVLDAIDAYLRAARAEPNSAYHHIVAKWFGEEPSGGIPTWVFWTLGGALALLVIFVGGTFILRREVRRKTRELMRLTTAVEQMPESVVITGLDGRILYANPAFERVTGYPREEVVGRVAQSLHAQLRLGQPHKDVAEAMRTGRTWQGRLEAFKKSGAPVVLDIVIAPVREEDGGLSGHIVLERDVTEQVAIEEHHRHAQRIDSIGRLAGGVAHDFNNILTAIFGSAELAVAAIPAGSPAHGPIQGVLEAAGRAAALTRQLLMFARRQASEPTTVDINELLAGLRKFLTRVIGEQVIVTIEPAESLWPVRADPGQLEQVFVNLAVNARDAMPNGGRLTIRTANASVDEEQPGALIDVAPGDYVAVTVTDTGTGMTDEVKSHLFEPFFTTKPEGQGTGLGLATSLGIIQRHGGQVTFESEVGKGTAFTIWLPRVSGEADGKPVESTSPGLPRGNETILVVEDDADVRRLIASMLTRLGYTVLEAGDGDDAVALARSCASPIAMVLTDMVLPGMGGLEVADAVAAVVPTAKLAFMSGYPERALQVTSEGGRRRPFLHKPFRHEDLAQFVRGVLEHAAMGDGNEADGPAPRP